MKVYVVYQLGYTGSNELEILGVYKNVRFAEDKYFEQIRANIKEFDFGCDKECDDVILDNTTRMTRLFKGGYQENWDNYLEIYLEEQEVK